MAKRLTAIQKKAVQAIKEPKVFRTALRLNQTTFWTPYGVTQSGGSRYESGRAIPNSTAMLMVLHVLGVVSDEDLATAKKLAELAGERSGE